MNKIKLVIQLFKNMGFRYLYFKIQRSILIKTGVFQRQFPKNPSVINIISLDEWKNNLPPFFFKGKAISGLKKKVVQPLNDNFNEISSGIYTFFGKSKFNLGVDYDWITNPLSGYKYDVNKNWASINDLSQENGDIKFVWEKARFSFLYDIIRFDYHHNKDCAEIVFKEINSFIDKNPINQGPNYVCSQEISLRVINWTFAIFYFKDSTFLNQDLFNKIINSIYWQVHHVYKNINYSRVAVRNNHAITETLMLYLSYLLFPFLPDVKRWSKKGKKWFEEEILYQIYEDGTYLQFSNNYHRVVVQLLTVGICLAKLNNETFIPEVYSKAKKSLDFLYNSMDNNSGMLPNYGSNDGALFFKLNDQDYRDFRPQLQALSYALDIQDDYYFENFSGEDIRWLGYVPKMSTGIVNKPKNGVFSYPVGGYYIARDNESMTYIRCGRHKDRPAQADNLHLDIWYKGINIFRDNGSFMYNAEPKFLKYFMGTLSHNSIMLDEFDQMLKGPRFIWLDWSQSIGAEIMESESYFEFNGTISAFKYLGKGIQHRRKIIKEKGIPRWIIEDEVIGTKKFIINQLWHFDPEFEKMIIIESKDTKGNVLPKEVYNGWYSSYYGIKEETKFWKFSTGERIINTEIEIAL